MDVRNKKVTVVGLGNSGMTSALLLCEQGAIVSVTDRSDTGDIRKNARALEEKYAEIELGKHTENFLEGTELFVVSPGVEESSLPLRYADERKIPVISELELGYHFCKAPIVAVTGTNGKSTVVSLLGGILRASGIDARVCGNIGNALSGEVGKMEKRAVVVLEVSSFQLERIMSFRPKIAIILNAARDHLDRHRSFGDYLAAKKRIFENQEDPDVTILNYDDRDLRGILDPKRAKSKVLYFSAKKKVEGAYLEKGCVKTFLEKRAKPLFRLEGMRLEGHHNVENVLAAALAARLLGADRASAEKAVKEFAPLKHRFERVAAVKGVEFINDSKATNVDSARRAIESIRKKGILIAGGKDKNLSYGDAVPDIKKKIKKVILIGEASRKMKEAFGKAVPVEETGSLEAAVTAAFESAADGDCVLFSPMCSSFDMFKSYAERGEVFKRAVAKLKTQVSG